MNLNYPADYPFPLPTDITDRYLTIFFEADMVSEERLKAEVAFYLVMKPGYKMVEFKTIECPPDAVRAFCHYTLGKGYAVKIHGYATDRQMVQNVWPLMEYVAKNINT